MQEQMLAAPEEDAPELQVATYYFHNYRYNWLGKYITTIFLVVQNLWLGQVR